MKFNSNKERETYWKTLVTTCSATELEKAINTLKTDTAKVIDQRYRKGHSLKEIALNMKRSITVIRNHHNRGIYKLYRYFNPHSAENI
jgi:DNA-directed RNA polymerase specialized sigma24 family protein